jgi:hypothetical protein
MLQKFGLNTVEYERQQVDVEIVPSVLPTGWRQQVFRMPRA